VTVSNQPTRAEVLAAYRSLPPRPDAPAADLSRDVIACGDESVREAALALGRDLGRPVVDVDVASGWLPETPAPARVHLPLAMASSAPTTAVPQHTAEALAASANATGLWICAPDLASALTVLPRYPGVRAIELELDDYTGLAAALGSGDALAGRRLVRTRAATVAQATLLLSIPGDFGVVVALTKATASWLKALDPVPSRLALYQPTHERMTESLHHDVDLRAFFAEFTQTVPVEGIPACVTGRPAPSRPRVLDTAMMAPEGGLEIFRYAQRYIHAHYKARSLRCKPCVHYESCDGMHINYIRAHGYGVMQPVLADAE